MVHGMQYDVSSWDMHQELTRQMHGEGRQLLPLPHYTRLLGPCCYLFNLQHGFGHWLSSTIIQICNCLMYLGVPHENCSCQVTWNVIFILYSCSCLAGNFYTEKTILVTVLARKLPQKLSQQILTGRHDPTDPSSCCMLMHTTLTKPPIWSTTQYHNLPYWQFAC